MIETFKQIKKNSIKRVGGKAVNLGILYQAKFNVPDGMVVTTKAYEDFLQKNQLHDTIFKLLKNVNIRDINRLEEISAGIGGMIREAQLQPALEEEINKQLPRYKGKTFAVRSSAVSEDLPGASFAGQLDSYLEVPTGEVTEKVKECFASLYSARAILYREIKKFPHETAIAVVIQEMIPAEFAGVMFTLDPTTKKNSVIEAASGLGENVVSGNVSPNNYKLNRQTCEIEESDEKEEFPSKIIKEIAAVGMKIENYFKAPQDIEFAVAGGEIYILQARPITTL
ncbi:MAG: hypothetical protein GY757_31995 [bacterium]|nr:hypothetical protein [bacterium]